MNDSRWYLAATGVADLLPSAGDSSTPTGMQGVTVTHSSGHSSALSTQQRAGFCLYSLVRRRPMGRLFSKHGLFIESYALKL